MAPYSVEISGRYWHVRNTKNRPFLKIYYYSNTLSFAHYVSYNRVDALDAFRRKMVKILSNKKVNNCRFLVVAHMPISAAYFYAVQAPNPANFLTHTPTTHPISIIPNPLAMPLVNESYDSLPCKLIFNIALPLSRFLNSFISSPSQSLSGNLQMRDRLTLQQTSITLQQIPPSPPLVPSSMPMSPARVSTQACCTPPWSPLHPMPRSSQKPWKKSTHVSLPTPTPKSWAST